MAKADPIPEKANYLDMPFPLDGIDLSMGYSMQKGGTTPIGQNVRGYEPLTNRSRGGSRPGLAKYVQSQVNGNAAIQELSVVVGVGYTPPGAIGAPIQTSVGTVASSTAVSSTFANAVATANAVIVLVTSELRLPTSVTDSAGNAYTLAKSGTQTNENVAIYYSAAVTGGPSFSVTAHFASSTGCSIVGVEVNGLIVAPLDQINNNGAAATTAATAGAVTTTQAAELAVTVLQSVVGIDETQTVSNPSGWTSAFAVTSSHPTRAAFLTLGSIQTINPAFTLSNSGTYAAAIATFKFGSSTAQTSQSGRVVTLVGVSQGVVAVCPAGGSAFTPAANTTGSILATSGVIRSASNNQKLYFADGAHWLYYDPSLNAVKAWTATRGQLPGSNLNPIDYPRLIATWRGRTVVSGIITDPQNWFMSAVNDPYNWDYAPTPTLATQAIAGNNSPLGLVGDVITCLIPYRDDVLIFGGDHTIWMCSGDPMGGGQIDLVSDTIGMAYGLPWCKGPDGVLYFFSNKMGIYRMEMGSAPQRISQQVEQLLRDIDTGLNVIRMQYDDLFQGVHVWITLASAVAATTHFFWELRSNAWWTDVFANTNHSPLCCVTFDGNLPGDRRSLIGSWDGYVRCMASSATSDDGTAISSAVVIGPLVTKDFDDILLKELLALMGETSGSVTYSVYVGRTAELALSSTPVCTGNWKASRNFDTYVRRAGHAIYLKISSTNQWAVEKIRSKVIGKGAIRARGY